MQAAIVIKTANGYIVAEPTVIPDVDLSTANVAESIGHRYDYSSGTRVAELLKAVFEPKQPGDEKLFSHIAA